MAALARILVADPDPVHEPEWREALSTLDDVEVTFDAGLGEGRAALTWRSCDVAIADLAEGVDGPERVRRILAELPGDVALIVVAVAASVQAAMDCIRLGAAEFLLRPVEPRALAALARKYLIERGWRASRERADGDDSTPVEIVGASPSLRRTLGLVRRLAPADLDCLVLGESGTGKELIARALHQLGRRRAGPWVAINCCAIPATLLAGELFGHEPGAYTGASYRSMGLIAVASGGTLVLDEVGDLPLPLQAKLLRTLQERAVRPLGARSEVPVDIRIIACTNRSLPDAVARGTFRAGLLYRLDGMRITVPPLRDRAGDVRRLAEFFLGRFASEAGRPIVGFTDSAMAALEAHSWPGNVRELQNAVRRAVAMARSSLVGVADLPAEAVPSSRPGSPAGREDFFALRSEAAKAFDREFLTTLLRLCGGNVSVAAKRGSIQRESLYRLLRRYRIDPATFRRRPKAPPLNERAVVRRARS